MLNKATTIILLFSVLTGSNVAVAADSNAKEVDKGRAIYAQRCLHCHGEKADGKGHLIDFLKVSPADLTSLQGQNKGCITERVLKAVLGRHATGNKEQKMPLLKDYLSPEDVYSVSEFIKSIQK